MALEHPSSPAARISSQAGLATIRTGGAATPTPGGLLTLIDAYATARAVRDESYREHAAWTFDDAHAAMLNARAAVADALGIPAATLPPLSDPISHEGNARLAATAGDDR